MAMGSDQAGPLESNGTLLSSFRQGADVETGPHVIGIAF